MNCQSGRVMRLAAVTLSTLSSYPKNADSKLSTSNSIFSYLLLTLFLIQNSLTAYQNIPFYKCATRVLNPVYYPKLMYC